MGVAHVIDATNDWCKYVSGVGVTTDFDLIPTMNEYILMDEGIYYKAKVHG